MLKKVSITLFMTLSFGAVAQTNLNHYQYWFNDNYGDVQTVPVTSAAHHQLNIDIDAGPLADGVNVLNIRYMDEDRVYSSTLSRVFYKNTEQLVVDKKIVAYEFWFNNDYGNVARVPVSPAAQHQLVVNLDASSLADGVNILNVRYKDEVGIFSSTVSRVFYKNTAQFVSGKKLVAYEYWFNGDQYNVEVVPITPTSMHQLNANIDVSSLAEGVNTLQLRYMDEKGIYSATLGAMFYKKGQEITQNRIFGYQYWFDDDFGNVVYSPLPTPVVQMNLEENIDMKRIPKGEHTFHCQFQDSLGVWSSIVTDTIRKDPFPIAWFTYDLEPDCDSTVVDFTNKSIDGDIYLWDFGDGTTDTAASPSRTYYSHGWHSVRLTATDTATHADSTWQVSLFVPGNTTGTSIVSTCGSYDSPSGKYQYTASGVYTDTVSNQWGCDSIITLDVTILEGDLVTDVVTACDSYTWIDGNTYTSSNNSATYTTTNVAGCDSIVALDLTINVTPDNHVTQNGNTLSAAATGVNYRWLNCEGGYEPITGETGQSFTADMPGNYAVEVSRNGCADTSQCIAITTVGLIESSFEHQIHLYPNPTDGDLVISLGKRYPAVSVEITDTDGRLVRGLTIENSDAIHAELNGAAGVYIVTVNAEDKRAVLRIVKK